RAAAQPNRSYLGEWWPIIASRVLIARYATRPGSPDAAPHSSGATTASEVLSATDSITARAISLLPSSAGSRPHRLGSTSRAAGRSFAASATTARSDI